MSDTRLLTSIIEAIQIITDKKVSQASFDKTIKAIVKQVVDLAIGEYLIKYQDSEFIAYATSAEIYYKKGDLVFILIPGNDWSRVKTIIGGTNQKATTFVEPPAARNAYNTVGRNGVISVGENLYPLKLNSYENTLADLYNKKEENNLINIDEKGIINNIKENGGFVVGAYFKTQLDDSQIGGDYGLIFNLLFSDSTVNSSEIVSTKPYILNSNNVIGNPYLLRDYTYVNSFIDDINVDLLVGIQSIQIYCTGFNTGVENTTVTEINPEELFKSTIYVKDIQIQAIESLTTLELNGYSLNIDCSNTGNILGKTTAGDVVQILLNAELKSKGKVVSKDVEYYWFRLNGSIFRGNKKYSSYGGDGWECLNWLNLSPVPYKDGKMIFCGKEILSIKDRKIALIEKNTRIKCVATYKNLNSTSKEITLINNNINENIIIISSDKISLNEFKTIYYLDNGHPTLTCEVKDKDGNDLAGDGVSLSYEWYLTLSNGISKKSSKNEDKAKVYKILEVVAPKIQNNFNNIVSKKSSVNSNTDKKSYLTLRLTDLSILSSADLTILANELTNKDKTKLTREIILSAWEKQKNIITYIDGNKYVNFPINSILNLKKISCVVYNNGVYIGTASITLYNKQLLAGMYSVILNNGSQVFHYDGKGNSPASPQIERPLLIQPLTFGLLDKDGTLIPFEQIVKSGLVDWIIPNIQTLLASNNDSAIPIDEAKRSLVLKGMTLPLAADNYNIYRNISSFHFTIANQYDEKNIYNDILLHIKYKDLIFDTYTNFSFPKQGDPGTNGTDYVAKIVASTTTDRIYISDRSTTEIFDDNGASVSGLNFLLYDNSKLISASSVYWNCPPVVQNDKGKSTTKMNTYLSSNPGFSKPKLNVANKDVTTILSDKPVNIIRAQSGGGRDQNSLFYFALYPVCTEFVNLGYRLKVKPKTGFKYAVYLEDGTRPDYDNSLPFEIIVLHVNGDYWLIDTTSRTYTWYAIGNVELNNSLNNGLPSNKKYFKPKNNFNGDDLTSAILVLVSSVGRIHIPIYMCLNRYGHAALNGWDGNSILLNGQGDTILAPQVGAGKKLDNNTFTGILMGNVKTSSSNDTGLFGYDKGQRSIFLDASSGKAEFGKDKSAKIILNPRVIMDNKAVAFLHSSEFAVDEYIKKPKEGRFLPKTNDGKAPYTGGLMIDLTSPAIQFGSGNFYITPEGYFHAAGGGDIAGWNITDNALLKRTTLSIVGMNSNPDKEGGKAFYAGSNTEYNFYVTHSGYLFSKLGKIGGWNIRENTLSNGNVGMNSDPGNEKQNKAFYADPNFYVRHDGYLFSKSGNIAGWDITENSLQKEKTNKDSIGFGTKPFTVNTNNRINYGISPDDNSYDGGIIGKIWSHIQGGTKFVVNNEGKVFASSGYIGGWKISEQYGLQSSKKIDNKNYHVLIQSDGTLTQYEGNDSSKNINWQISSTGHALFKDIEALSGWIGKENEGWQISSNSICDNKQKVKLTVNSKREGSITAENGSIGGWAITGSLLKGKASGNDQIILTSNGNIKNNNGNWSIDRNGEATFKKVTIAGTVLNGQSLTAGGGTISGHGVSMGGTASKFTPGKIGIGNTTMTEWTEDTAKIAAKALLVSNSFVYNKKTVKWKQIGILGGSQIEGLAVTVTIPTRDVTINGTTFKTVTDNTATGTITGKVPALPAGQLYWFLTRAE